MPSQGNRKALPTCSQLPRERVTGREGCSGTATSCLSLVMDVNSSSLSSQICSVVTKDQSLEIHTTTINTYCVGAQHVVRSLSSGCVWRRGCVEQVAPQLHMSRCSAAVYIVFTAFAFGTGFLVATNTASASWLYLCVGATS